MHYYAYEFAHAVLSPLRIGVHGIRNALDWPFNPIAKTPFGRQLAAACEVFENVTRRYGKPEFGLKTTRVGNIEVPVREHVVASTPFCNLLHFERDHSKTGKRYEVPVGTDWALSPDNQRGTLLGATCDQAKGGRFTADLRWMMHVWVAPEATENPDGVFAYLNGDLYEKQAAAKEAAGQSGTIDE